LCKILNWSPLQRSKASRCRAYATPSRYCRYIESGWETFWAQCITYREPVVFNPVLFHKMVLPERWWESNCLTNPITLSIKFGVSILHQYSINTPSILHQV
jgi:hypothetical protein